MYKIVTADSRYPRDGRFIEALGQYKPLENPPLIEINEDRAMYWLKVGAQPSDTVRSLLSKKGIMLKLHLDRKGKTEEEMNAELETWRAEQEAKAGSKLSKKQRRAKRQKEEAEIKEKQEAEEKAEAEAEQKKAEAEQKKAEAEQKKAEATTEESAPEEPAAEQPADETEEEKKES